MRIQLRNFMGAPMLPMPLFICIAQGAPLHFYHLKLNHLAIY